LPRAQAPSHYPPIPTTCECFPERGFCRTSGWGHTIEQLDAALRAARLVIIFNPYNPTGSLLDREGLTAAALHHPHSVLVEDCRGWM